MATSTRARAAQPQAAAPAQKAGDLALFKPARFPYDPLLGEKYEVDEGRWKALVDTIFPLAKSGDIVVTALAYCKARGLDPFKRVVHIVPMYSKARGGMVETIWPGIAELRTTAFRTGAYAGCDDTAWGEIVTRKFEDVIDVYDRGQVVGTKGVDKTVSFHEWAQVTVYRIVGGTRCKFVGPKVYWEENYASVGKTIVPNEMWADRPDGQLEKCAEAAALRKAFPEEIGGDLTAEEMTGRQLDENDAATVAREINPRKPVTPPPPAEEEETAANARAEPKGAPAKEERRSPAPPPDDNEPPPHPGPGLDGEVLPPESREPAQEPRARRGAAGKKLTPEETIDALRESLAAVTTTVPDLDRAWAAHAPAIEALPKKFKDISGDLYEEHAARIEGV